MSDRSDKMIAQAEKFIAALEALSAGDRAKLKRNAGKTLAQSRGVHAVFYKALPFDAGKFQRERDAFFLVATLHPLAEAANTKSLANAMRIARSKKQVNEDGFDRRFESLLNANLEQLPFRLRQIVRLLKSADVGIDWPQLLVDIQDWTQTSRFVQENWARDYYAKQENN